MTISSASSLFHRRSIIGNLIAGSRARDGAIVFHRPPGFQRCCVYCAVRWIRLASALVFAAVLVFLAALHVYWALGGAWGSSVSIPTVGGRRTISPGPLATNVVAFLLLAGAVLICGQVHLFSTGRFSALFRLGSWCVCVVFLLRTVGDLKTFGIFKTVRGTPFAYWDTRLFSPLCFLLAVLAGVAASGSD